MADTNKSLQLMLIWLCLLLYIAIIPTRCAILSYNNRLSQWQKLQSIPYEHFQGSDHTNERTKRDVNPPSLPSISSTTKPKAKQSSSYSDAKSADVEFYRSDLSGTEKLKQAYIHWIGKNTSETVLVLTHQWSSVFRDVVESQLWCSDDYGISFQRMKFDKDAKIWYFYTFPNSSKLLFTDVSAKKVYTIQEAGCDKIYKAYSVPVEPELVLPHPSKENYILLYSLKQRKLYSSLDFAETWNLVGENVLPNFYWDSKGYYENLDLVHMEIEDSSPSKSRYKACDVKDCHEVRTELGDELGSFEANTLVVHKEFMFVQKNNNDGQDSHMMVSHKRRQFQRAYFPEDVKATDFMLLNLDDDQVFVAVNEGDHVNLYLSGIGGHEFVLSFPNVYHVMRHYWFEIDFHEVQGMNWTFIVNKKVKSNTGKNSPSYYAQSYISFDKGGNWAPLQLNDELKKECGNIPDCSLLLHVKQSSTFASIVSEQNAPGIILSHGTLGSQKTNISNQPLQLFVSRDGGWTWMKAPFAGLYRLTVLDQGSILSAILDGAWSQNSTTVVHFSYDEGKTWTKKNFDTKGVIVNGVLTEPNILTMSETLFGHEGKNDSWVLITLDFSKILPKVCTESDYESWFPKDYNSKKESNYTLGRMVQYRRRKQNAVCHNGDKSVGPKVVPNEVGDCSAEDYECDFGFRETLDGKCEKLKWYDIGYLPLSCYEGELYSKSQGYRKISSDMCKENAESDKYGNVEANCPVVAPHGLSISAHEASLIPGVEGTFYLDQFGGSTKNVTYTWSFDDLSSDQSFNDFKNASRVTHIFQKAGHYKVKVVATCSKGKNSTTLTVHIQERITEVLLMTPKAGRVGEPIQMSLAVLSYIHLIDAQTDHVHFVWTFGDEKANVLPLLTWNRTVTHTYEKSGTYKVNAEAVNSLSSLSKEFHLKIYDDAKILILTLGMKRLDLLNNPLTAQIITQMIMQQLSDDVGVTLKRLEAVVMKIVPPTIYLYIYPRENSSDASEPPMDKVMKGIMDLVKNRDVGINPLGRQFHLEDTLKVISAVPYPKDDTSKSEGPNMKAVYIAAPVLIIGVVSTVFIALYCRRKIHNVRQFNLLNTQDDSDALLDDDEEPLDLNMDFGIRENSRDEGMIDPESILN